MLAKLHSAHITENKMEPVSILVKQSIPRYFENLPIPNTFGGWFRLGVKDWLSLVPLAAVLGGVGYMSYKSFCPIALKKRNWINPDIGKENQKHVDVIDVESIGESAAFCRCWRSKKWPYCDGAHGAWNRETGDNTGPVLVKRMDKSGPK